MRRLKHAIGFLALVIGGAALAAPVELTNRVLVEQRAAAADGTVHVTLVPAGRVVPGDRLVYALGYRNTGSRAVDNIVLANRLPQDVRYRAPQVGSPAPELSVDGTTFGALADLRVVTANGDRPATAADITHVRWRVPGPIVPGAKGEVAFQAVLK